MSLKRILLALAFLASPALSKADAFWPRFRGPAGTGIASGKSIPPAWTESDLNWKVPLPGTGHSSPVVWGEKVFLTCAENKTGAVIAVCLRRTDGSLLWKRTFPSFRYRMNRDNSYAASTPAVDDQALYLYWAVPKSITVLALDHRGRERWRRDLGPFESIHGSGVSPIVCDDLLIVPNDQKGKSFLIALDKKTGKTIWRLDRRSGRAAYSTPGLRTLPGGGRELLFTSSADGMTAVDPATGTVNWSLPDAFPQRVVSSPITAGDLIIGTCGTGGSGKRLVAVRPGTKDRLQKAELAYELTRDVPYVPTPLAKGGLLFLLTDRGRLSCVKAATGEVLWKKRLGANFYASLVCVENRLYAVSRKGTVFAIEAADTFRLLGRTELGQGTHATPAVADGTLYLRTFSRLLSIGGEKRKP